MPILTEEQTTDCTHPGPRNSLPHLVLTCPEADHPCRRLDCVLFVCEMMRTMFTYINVRSPHSSYHLARGNSRKTSASSRWTEQRSHPSQHKSAGRQIASVSTGAHPEVTPPCHLHTKTTLGILPDGLSPCDTAPTLTKLCNIAWALTGCTIDAQRSRLPPPPPGGHAHLLAPGDYQS
jgi:hypothetical protein